MSKGMKKQWSFGTKRGIALVVCSVLLLVCLVTGTFAWFRGIIEAPGGTVSTGKIVVEARGWEADEPTASATLTPIFSASMDGAKQTVTPLKTEEQKGTIVLKDKDDTYDALFFIRKNTESIDVDINVQLFIDDPDDDLGGFSFSFTDITDHAAFSEDDYTEESIQPAIKNYFDNAGVPSYGTGLPSLSGRSITATIPAVNKNYCVLRFSCKINEDAQDVVKYTGKSYELLARITVAQTGALNDENTGTVWEVSTLSELSAALIGYVSGDTIRVVNDITWTGDLNRLR